MRDRVVLCVLVLLVGAWSAATADSQHPGFNRSEAADPQRIYYQDTVVVGASRTGTRLRDLATSGTVIAPQQIRIATTSSVAGLLAMVPGLNVVDLSGSESMGQVESRGFTSLGHTSHLLVLIDGIPVNDFDGERADWNLLSRSQLERVEILRGPASFLWGNAAMAGVVNLVTRRGGQTGLQRAETAGGSYGEASGTAAASWVRPGIQCDVSGFFRRADGFREHSGWNSAGGYALLRAPVAVHWQLNGRALFHRGDEDVPGALPDPLWRTAPRRALTVGLPDAAAVDNRSDRTLNVALGLAGLAARGVKSVFTLALDARDVDSRETIIPVGTLNHTARASAVRGDARVEWPAPAPRGPEVFLGVETELGGLRSRYYDTSAASPGTPVGSGDIRRATGAISLLARLQPASRWTVALGARLDWLRAHLQHPSSGEATGNDDLSAFSPSGSISYDSGRLGEVYATVSGSFKAPTLEQLYDPRPYLLDPDGPGPAPPITLQVSSHALRPQRGNHAELGLRGRIGPRASVDVCGYYSRSNDEIGFDLAHFRYANIARSTHAGLESSLETDLGTRAGTRLSYSWTRAVFEGDEHDGKQINAVPIHQLCGSLTLHSWHGASITTSVRYVGVQWLDEVNLYQIPSFAVADVGLIQAVGSLEFFTSSRNVFDRRYAGTGYLTIDATGSPLPLYYPGAGRMVSAGLRFAAK